MVACSLSNLPDLFHVFFFFFLFTISNEVWTLKLFATDSSVYYNDKVSAVVDLVRSLLVSRASR